MEAFIDRVTWSWYLGGGGGGSSKRRLECLCFGEVRGSERVGLCSMDFN